MRAGGVTMPFVQKELRELGPVWLGALFVGGLGPIGFTWVVIAGASVSLGVMSIGHEFRRRTIDMLLSQPLGRGRVLALKLGLLTAMLLILGGVSWFRLGTGASLDWLLLMPGAIGLCIAPALTVLARGELGGLVLSASIPAFIWMGGRLTAVFRYGSSPASSTEILALESAIFANGMVLALVVGAVASVWLFRRLEATGGILAAQVRFGPRLLRRAARGAAAAKNETPRRRRATTSLIVKELHLYGLPVAVAGLYCLTWIAVTRFEATALQAVDVEMLTRGLVFVYSGAIVLLVSSLASAEERQLGTLAGETLLPISARYRWAVKVGCASVVMLLLGVALPLVLAVQFPSPDPRGFRALRFLIGGWGQGGFFGTFFSGLAGAAGAFAVGLYVSSLMTGGLRTLLVSVGAIVALPSVLLPVVEVSYWVSRGLGEWLAFDSSSWLTAVFVDGRLRDRFQFYLSLPATCAVVLVGLVVRYAGHNHASFERPARLLRRQVARLAVVLVVSVGVQVVANALSTAAFMSRYQERVRMLEETRRAKPPAGSPSNSPQDPQLER